MGTSRVEPEHPTPGAPVGRPVPARVAALCLAALVALGVAARVGVALADPGFQRDTPVGMLRSDPALLYYFTERVVGAPGLLPADWSADPRVEHPEPVDVPREFTVGQELLVGWAYRLLGRPGPLHLFCLWVAAVVASLGVLGVYLGGRWATGSRGWGLVAAGLFTGAAANYRTIGFLLMREDVSLPLLALHLGLVARALRRPGPGAFALAGLAGGAALATWHAAGFFLFLAWLPAVAWVLRRGESPLRAPGSWGLPAGVLATCVVVPVLRAKGAATSAGVLLVVGAWLAGALDARRGPSRRRSALVVGATLGAGSLAAWAAGRGASYGHVLELVVSKLVYLGQLPPDPAALSFDARLLWQGPFATSGGFDWGQPTPWAALAVLAALLVGTVGAWRRGNDAPLAVVGGGTLVGALAALLVQRAWVLPGLLGPVAVVLLLRRARARRSWAAGALGLALVSGGTFLARHELRWYRPLSRAAEVRALVAWVADETAPDAVLATDFVNGPTLLAHTGRAIALQPKYEAGRSRERARAFLEAYFRGTPEDFHALLRDRFRATHLVIDRFTLDELSRYTAGVSPLAGPRPEAAVSRFAVEGDELAAAGFRRVYASAGAGGRATFRVYELSAATR